MTIDWSKAPEGATHYCKSGTDKVVWLFPGDYEMLHRVVDGTSMTTGMMDGDPGVYRIPRPSEPKPYTRDEALQFLVERLDSWPTDIADAPLCPGWGWELWTCFEHRAVLVSRDYGGAVFVAYTDWCASRPDFVPFVSVEDAQPAPDMVNHPPHYQSDSGIECIDAIRAVLGHDGFVSYCVGNSIKYLWRDKTDRVEDLRKAAWYLDRAIQEVSGDAQTDR